MNVATPPSLEDLYLAYRQAKIAIFFEHRGVGLDQFARFESDLFGNLRKLRRTLAKNGGWFNGRRLGDVWVAPKKYRTDRQAADTSPDRAVTRIGVVEGESTGALDVQIALFPNPRSCNCGGLVSLALWTST